jgi:hypothetical protein
MSLLVDVLAAALLLQVLLLRQVQQRARGLVMMHRLHLRTQLMRCIIKAAVSLQPIFVATGVGAVW